MVHSGSSKDITALRRRLSAEVTIDYTAVGTRRAQEVRPAPCKHSPWV